MVLGTPLCMSPEQARGEQLDASTDIFSLAVVIFEMIAGRVPFEGATTSDVIASILVAEPPPLSRNNPSTPGVLERIVAKAMAKDRTLRYGCARDLLSDLWHLKENAEHLGRARRVQVDVLPALVGRVQMHDVADRPPAGHRWRALSIVVPLFLCIAAFGNRSQPQGSSRPRIAVLPSKIFRRTSSRSTSRTD
jgi:serine/threonine protein kinase